MESVAVECWYALRVTYGREMKLREFLMPSGVTCFVPMCYRETERNGKRSRRLVPAIRNIIFVYSTLERIGQIKRQLGEKIPVRYIMDCATGEPVVVPAREMEYFIAVSSTNNDELIYLTDVKQVPRRGQRVKVTGGIFEGIEGEVVRIRKDRRVMVSLPGVMAVVTTFIEPRLLEIV